MTEVLVSIVTWNDEAVLDTCLASIEQQTTPMQVSIFDNASRDKTVKVAERRGHSVFLSNHNQGFAAGHNHIVRKSNAPYVLFLNADTRLSPAYVERVLETLKSYPGAGSIGGKLYRMKGGTSVFHKGRPVLDSTGIYMTPEQRHFDRGAGQPDLGQYNRTQEVFGITGAVLLCSRQMLDDIACDGQYFDEDFFVYREDADLAWRAQLRGWKALYEPGVWAWHERKVLPRGRSEYEPLINFHSVKNRFLMRSKNMDYAVRQVCTPWMQVRDLGILLYVLARERTSLRAFGEVRRLHSRTREKRRLIQGGRKVAPREMASWFRFRPVVYDV